MHKEEFTRAWQRARDIEREELTEELRADLARDERITDGITKRRDSLQGADAARRG